MVSLRSLPKVRDSISFVYVERCRIEQDTKAVAIWQEDGRYVIPCAGLTTLMLGPGSVITHAAIKTLADNACTVQWVGEDCLRFYANGSHHASSVERLYRQAEVWADPQLHLQVVRQMYQFRFQEPLQEGLTLQQIRGLEGVRVRTVYGRLSKAMGVEWKGRDYKLGSWGQSDPVNRALSRANSYLYAVCQAALTGVGYSPALGFIHTGKPLSFVYDVADLYKTEISIPAAFEAVAEVGERAESHVRRKFRQKLTDVRFLKRVVEEVDQILGLRSQEDRAPEVGALWDDHVGKVEGGQSWGESTELEVE